MTSDRNTEIFIKDAREVHGSLYDYSKVNYTNSTTKVCIIDPEYGEFWQIYHNHVIKKQNHPKRGIQNNTKQRSSNTEAFIKKAQKIHNNFYDYRKVEYINSNTKVVIIDKELGSFTQKPSNHLSGQGHPGRTSEKVRAKTKLPFEEFVKRSKIVHGDIYNYDNTNYINNRTLVEIIDPVYGIFKVLPHLHYKGQGHPMRTSSHISRISLSWLLSLPNATDFIIPYQEPTIILNGKKRKVDAYDPITNTCYEFEGSYYHGWNGKAITNRKSYDKTLEKNQDIISAGYNLVVMWEHEWLKLVTREDWDRIPVNFDLTKIFVEKARQIHGNRFDYSKTIYTHNAVTVTIIDRESMREFQQSPNSHLSGHGYKPERNLDTFIEQSRKIYGTRYNYSKCQFVNNHTDVVLLDTLTNQEIKTKPRNHLRYYKKFGKKQNCL